MSDLTGFLLARIAEDEAVAREAIAERLRVRPDWTADTEVGALDWPSVAAVGGERWLAECEAKRRMVEWISAWQRDVATEGLRILALPYRDHPDFNPEWGE